VNLNLLKADLSKFVNS